MTELIKLNAAHESITGAIEFTHPEWLWALAVLLLATLVWRYVGYRKQSASLATGYSISRHRMLHPLLSLIPKRHSSNKMPIHRSVIYAIVLIGLVISLAEPVRIGARLPDPPQERDIVFIVDTSISMTLKDYVLEGKRIDRMTLLKGVLDRFIQRLPGERIGIIVFGDAAYTLVPLTRDHSLLRRMLSRVQATMVGRFNNIGEAIALAVKQTREQNIEGRHRVLVLLTDADKPTGSIDPQVSADLVLEAGLPLYTVAIGATTAEAEEQRTTGLIYEPADSELLLEISERTGGRNYQAGDYRSLENAVADISSNETNQRIVAPRYYRETLYYWPLLFSVVLLSLLSFSTILKRLFVFLFSETNSLKGSLRKIVKGSAPQ